MARWADASDVLPVELRIFDPRKWLAPGEDETDPVRCHIFALGRYRDAVRAIGVDPYATTAATVTAGWFGPVATRAPGECPCYQCGRSEKADQ